MARTAFAELALALTAGEGSGTALTIGITLALTAGKGALTFCTVAAAALTLALGALA